MTKMVNKCLTLLFLIGFGCAVPLTRQAVSLPQDYEEYDSGLSHFGSQGVVRQGALLGVLGTALAPVLGAVVGPVFTNLANGLAGALTGSRPSSSAPAMTPTFDAYMIQIPGAEGPYMLLTQQTSLGSPLGGPYRTPNDAPLQVSPFGKIQVSPQQIASIQEEPISHDIQTQVTRGSFKPEEDASH